MPSPFPFEHKPTKLHEISAIDKELKENPLDVQTRLEDTGPAAG